jgi:hypothetical protein
MHLHDDPRARRAYCLILAGVTALILAGCGSPGGPTTPGGTDATGTAGPSATGNPPTGAGGPTPATSNAGQSPAGSGPSQAPPAPAGASGVDGTTVTQRCPVVTEEGCPNIPLATHVVVTDAAGTVATVDTGKDGHFRIGLKPGAYTVRATAVPPGVTRPAVAQFTVVSGHYMALTLSLDSGIR